MEVNLQVSRCFSWGQKHPGCRSLRPCGFMVYCLAVKQMCTSKSDKNLDLGVHYSTPLSPLSLVGRA